MTTTTTATIETLTASVHILKMGNRQITLGVYRQLDSAPYKDLEPFGRIRDPQDQGGTAVYAIGQHKETGTLVRSALDKPTWLIPEKYMSPEFHHYTSHARNGQKTVHVADSGTVNRRLFAEVRNFPCPGKSRRLTYGEKLEDAKTGKRGELATGADCDMPGMLEVATEEVKIYVKTFTAMEYTYREALALPLIVLAAR